MEEKTIFESPEGQYPISDTRGVLIKRLEQCKTRGKQVCCSFRLSEKEEEVRMSPKDLMNYGKQGLPEENVKNHEEMADMIMGLAQNDKDHELIQGIMETCIQNFVEEVQRLITRFKKEATQICSAFASEKQRKFTDS